ncbi:hypothetical protein HZS_4838 [Henneguya salminicola]|nr:hypothetical protein HZS_4838 [Henneguya salminicola]
MWTLSKLHQRIREQNRVAEIVASLFFKQKYNVGSRLGKRVLKDDKSKILMAHDHLSYPISGKCTFLTHLMVTQTPPQTIPSILLILRIKPPMR